MRTCIVILTWNRRKTLKKNLLRFHKHNGRFMDDHIIVVDNGSIDGTQKFLSESPYELLLQKKNLGAQKGKYIGWVHAFRRGYDFIFFLEDDFPCVRKIPFALIEKYMDDHPEVGYVRLNDKKYLKRHLISKCKIRYHKWENKEKFKFRKSNYHFTCNPIVFRSSIVPNMKDAKREYDYMRMYMDLYKYQAQLRPFCFKTKLMKRRLGWKH